MHKLLIKKEVKESKQSHIINIGDFEIRYLLLSCIKKKTTLKLLRYASLRTASYRNSVFNLPTFADFRGIIYTLSQYLSYQGDDICRSLLLFADKNERVLDDKGFEYLLFY